MRFENNFGGLLSDRARPVKGAEYVIQSLHSIKVVVAEFPQDTSRCINRYFLYSKDGRIYKAQSTSNAGNLDAYLVTDLCFDGNGGVTQDTLGNTYAELNRGNSSLVTHISNPNTKPGWLSEQQAKNTGSTE